MDDHGLAAAMRMSLTVFEQASRRSGRTERLIRAVRPTDIVITNTTAEKRRLLELLREAGKSEVVVHALSANSEPRNYLGTNRHGATILDHSWISAFWERRLDAINGELVGIEEALSAWPAPAPEESDMAWRFRR